MFEAHNDPARLTCTVRLTGSLPSEQVEELGRLLRDMTGHYRGGPHFYLLDVRGLRPLSAEATAALSRALAYAGAHGMARCAFVSDSAIARMQLQRLARTASPATTAPLFCGSLEEAERALLAERTRVRAGAATAR